MNAMEAQMKAAKMTGAMMIERDRLAIEGNSRAVLAITEFLDEAPMQSKALLHDIIVGA
jgi:hypothetical protein